MIRLQDKFSKSIQWPPSPDIRSEDLNKRLFHDFYCDQKGFRDKTDLQFNLIYVKF